MIKVKTLFSKDKVGLLTVSRAVLNNSEALRFSGWSGNTCSTKNNCDFVFKSLQRATETWLSGKMMALGYGTPELQDRLHSLLTKKRKKERKIQRTSRKIMPPKIK